MRGGQHVYPVQGDVGVAGYHEDHGRKGRRRRAGAAGRRRAAGEPVISSSPPTPARTGASTVTRGLVRLGGRIGCPAAARGSRNRSRGPITRTSSLPGRLASHWEHGIWHRSLPPPPLIRLLGFSSALRHGGRVEMRNKFRRASEETADVPVYRHFFFFL